jgi:GTP-binding protein
MGLGKVELSFTAWNPKEIRDPKSPRWVVLGKSNVGKSSFLNALVHPAKVFKVGSRPGVTTGIVAAQVLLGQSKNSALEIVDTPGFGFTIRSREDQKRWSELLDVLKSQQTHFEKPCFWLWLVDPMADFENDEKNLLSWLGDLDFGVVFTKCDRVQKKMHFDVKKRWAPLLEASPREPFWISAKKGEGFEEIFRFARHYVKGSPS